MELIVATRNQGKLREIRALLAAQGITVRGVAEFPDLPEVEEDGATFAANACKKATTIARLSGRMTLADDSGLVVDALGGEPGVHSARYAGAEADDDANNRKLLTELIGIAPAQRSAAFVCVMALAEPTGEYRLFEGRLPGEIIAERRGGDGFGYDPLFLVPSQGKTLAEIDLEEKNRISHRGQALRRVVAYLSRGA